MRREPRDLGELAQAIAATTARAVVKELRAQESPPPKAWLTPDETADYLSVSPRTLENWRRAGDGPPHFKAGHLVRYAVADLAV